MRSSIRENATKDTREINPIITISRRKSELYRNINYSKFNQSVLDQINYVRSYPGMYIKDLEKYKESLQENILIVKRNSEDKDNFLLGNEEIYVSEGRKLFDELINILKGLYKREPLQSIKPLTATADDFLLVLQMHDGSDDKILIRSVEDFVKRIRKYGIPHGLLGECIDYGSTSAEVLVLKLLLDDGDPSRTDRNIILNSNLNFVGVSCGILPSSQSFITIIDFCEHFFNFNEKIPTNLIKPSAKLQMHSKKRSSVLDYLHKEKNFSDNKTRLSQRKNGNAEKKKQESNKNELKILEQNFSTGENPHVPITTKSKLINYNINAENENIKVDGKYVSNNEKNRANNFQDLLSKVNPEKLFLDGKFMNRVKSQTRLRSSDNGARNISDSRDIEDNYDEISVIGNKNKHTKNPEKALSRSMINMAPVQDYDYNSINNPNTNTHKPQKNIYKDNRQGFKPSEPEIEFNFDKMIRKIEIEKNEHISCINTNKKIIVENRVEKFMVKKTIFFKDGSIDEWCYKEEL